MQHLLPRKREREVYTTLATMKTWAGSVHKTCYHENVSGKCIQHLLQRKLEREGYTALATTITYEGSACSTCKQENYRGQCIEYQLTRAVQTATGNSIQQHENLSEQSIEHLLTRKRTRAVHTAPANMNTWRQCVQHLQTRKLRAVHRAPTNTKTYAGSAYSTCKHETSERTTLTKGADKHLHLRLHKGLYQFKSPTLHEI